MAEVLRIYGFSGLELINPEKDRQGADILGNKNGIRVCVEVKTITKQSSGRKDTFLDEQLYEKAREVATKAAAQLELSSKALKCEMKILAYVINWFDQTILSHTTGLPTNSR